jgi:hypothetical protein
MERMPLARAELVCRYVLALAALADDPDVRALGRRAADRLAPVAAGIGAALGRLADGDESPGRLTPPSGDPDWIAADPVRLGPIAAVLRELAELLGEGRTRR